MHTSGSRYTYIHTYNDTQAAPYIVVNTFFKSFTYRHAYIQSGRQAGRHTQRLDVRDTYRQTHTYIHPVIHTYHT